MSVINPDSVDESTIGAARVVVGLLPIDHGADSAPQEQFGNDVQIGHGSTGGDVCQADPVALHLAGVGEMGIVELATPHNRRLLTRVVANPDDGGTSMIRLSRQQRKLLKVAAGDELSIRAAHVAEATRVVLEPLAPLGRSLSVYEDELSVELTGLQQLVQPDMLVPVMLSDFRRPVLFRVLSCTPERAMVDENTRIVMRTSLISAGSAANLVTFDDVGGLGSQIEQIRELVVAPLLYPEIYDHLGIEAPRGILLYGPPGVGKTHLTRAIANEVGAHFVYVNGPEVLSSVHGGTEANLRSIFEEAMESAPSIVLIDELDAIAPPRSDASNLDARMGTQLLSLLDGLVSMDGVIVIGTTNRPEGLDPALRRPGRLDREILVNPPDARGRLDILQIHTRAMPLTEAAQQFLPELARTTHGYTGADLVNLLREAALGALRRLVSPGLTPSSELIAQCQVDETDLRYALAQTGPSALREAVVSAQDTSWSDIGGLGEVIEYLRSAVEMPLAHPAAFADIGLVPSVGVVLHGPSGTGKSMLAMAVAKGSGANLITINGPEVFSKWLGESEETIRHAFHLARQSAPAVIVLDQLDAMAPRRSGESSNPAAERVVNQLVAELDGLRDVGYIAVIAITNRLDLVDSTLLRPGRLGEVIEVGMPDCAARAEILRLNLASHADLDEIGPAVREVAKRTEGRSGAELTAICNRARLIALRESSYARRTRVSGATVLAALDILAHSPTYGRDGNT